MRTISLALILSALSSLSPAMAASERTVNDLSAGALLGQIDSTRQLQREFATNDALLAQAGSDIGLTPVQYRDVRTAIASGRARYVELPRHIDAMSGDHAGRVFAVQNIRIPSGVYGWEVDLNDGHNLVKVYVPNRCGNISLVRTRRAEVLASAPVYHDTPAQVDAFTPLPATYSAPPDAAPAVAYAPTLSLPQMAAPAVAHHLALVPFLLGGAVAGFLAAGGHGAGVTIGNRPSTPPVVVTPTPTPVSCPSAKRRP
jgi:hypothetical protein